MSSRVDITYAGIWQAHRRENDPERALIRRLGGIDDDGDITVPCAECDQPVTAGGLSEMTEAFEQHYANDHQP